MVSQVKSITSKNVVLDYGSDTVYELDILVEGIEKGSFEGTSLKASTWQPNDRPEAWTGDQGQNNLPPENKKIRLYLRKAAGGSHELLTPNGWETI